MKLREKLEADMQKKKRKKKKQIRNDSRYLGMAVMAVWKFSDYLISFMNYSFPLYMTLHVPFGLCIEVFLIAI